MPSMASAPTEVRRAASSACVGWWVWLGHMQPPFMPPSWKGPLQWQQGEGNGAWDRVGLVQHPYGCETRVPPIPPTPSSSTTTWTSWLDK